jgi:hypothetical protein
MMTIKDNDVAVTTVTERDLETNDDEEDVLYVTDPETGEREPFVDDSTETILVENLSRALDAANERADALSSVVRNLGVTENGRSVVMATAFDGPCNVAAKVSFSDVTIIWLTE